MRIIMAAVAATFTMIGTANALVIGSISKIGGNEHITEWLLRNVSGLSVQSITMDASNAVDGALIFDTVGGNPSNVKYDSVTGVDTEVVTFSFTNFPNNKNFKLSSPSVNMDYSSGEEVVEFTSMVGIVVSFIFSDNSSWIGEFVYDSVNDKLVLQELSEVPLPAAIWLFAAGLGGLGFARKNKRSV